MRLGQRSGLGHALQWRSKRFWRRTLGRRAHERRLEAQRTTPSWRRVRELTAAPTTTADLDLAATMLDQLVPELSRIKVETAELVVDHTIASLQHDLRAARSIGRARDLAERFPGRTTSAPLIRLIDHLRDDGRFDAAVQLANDLFDSTGLAAFATALHKLQLRENATIDARATVDTLRARRPENRSTALLLEVDGHLNVDDYDSALHLLHAVRPTHTRGYSRRLLRTYVQRGQFGAVLDYLDRVESGLTNVDIGIHRFDAYFALGNRPAADAELAALVGTEDALDGTDDAVDERVIDRVGKAWGAAARQDLLDRLADGLELTSDEPSNLERAGIVLFRTNRPVDAVRTLRRADAAQPLTPLARQALAQSLYSLYEFTDALDEITALSSTDRLWAAMKLKGRILIQLGRPEEALENRTTYARPGDDTDQVLYHALLALGRHADAFRQHPFAADLTSLRADFPATAETHPDDHAGTRFVVADAGPGDEIQDASVFAELQALSDRLVTTCDPRLHSLLARSFPAIEFHPVERLRDPPHFASHGPAAPPRSGGALSRLLTDKAAARARECDRIVLGRAVKNARDLTKGPRPAAPFLVPDPALVSRVGDVSAGSPAVGLVWRSELLTSWRSIHYLGAPDLAPLADLKASIVCLQHDASAVERAELEQVFGRQLVFVDDIDLRNDFETTAALLSTLDLTIGVGTTMTNLAAAVGCPTLMMQATHFGSWLATDDHGSDFWYERCRVVVANPPYDLGSLVALTRDTARDMLNDARPRRG